MMKTNVYRQAMVLLQTAGVPKVGLMSQPVQANGAR